MAFKKIRNFPEMNSIVIISWTTCQSNNNIAHFVYNVYVSNVYIKIFQNTPLPSYLFYELIRDYWKKEIKNLLYANNMATIRICVQYN